MSTNVLILGDSFSNTEACKCTAHEMWYATLIDRVGGAVTDLTRPGASLEEIHIKFHQTIITKRNIDYVLVGLPPLDRRAMLTCQWEEEKNSEITMADYYKQFSHINALDVPVELIHFLHPLLILGGAMSTMLSILNYCKYQNIECMIVNMTHDFYQYNNMSVATNVFTKELFRRLHSDVHFLPHDQSCKNICKARKIKPHDYAKYSWTGHHGPHGQKIFGEHVLRYAEAHKLFIKKN